MQEWSEQQGIFEKQFELRYFEMNKYGEASPVTMLTLLEETASEHCSSINYSLYDLISQNIGWVLLSGAMKMERYPKHKEKITIQTWLSSYSTIKGIRENIIYDEAGNIIGRAKGLWLFFDIERKRPVPIFEDIKTKWSYNSDSCLDCDISKKIKAVETAGFSKAFAVNRYDIDMNQHVNNIRYLQWVMESIPDAVIDNCFLHLINGRFIAEAQYGDSIGSYTEQDINSQSFIHTIKVKEGNKVCATAKSEWKKR